MKARKILLMIMGASLFITACGAEKKESVVVEEEVVEEEEALDIDIDNEIFRHNIQNKVTLAEGEEIESYEWLDDEKTAFHIAIQRVKEPKDEYRHLSDYYFILNDDIFSSFKVDYPSKDAKENSDRYVWSACDFKSEYVDLNFDGKKDIVISLGHQGAAGTEVHCAYINESGFFTYIKSFESIPNYSIDTDRQVIIGTMPSEENPDVDQQTCYSYRGMMFVDVSDEVSGLISEEELLAMKPSQLFKAFCEGKIKAEDLNGDVVEAKSYNFRDEADATGYVKSVSPVDLDNDGQLEYILENPVYGDMCFDCKNGKVKMFASGDGTAAKCSYVFYNNVYWILHSDATHSGREYYELTRYNGDLQVEETMKFGWYEKEDEPGVIVYHLNGDESISEQQYNDTYNQVFGAR